jgi:hypothetical protein
MNFKYEIFIKMKSNTYLALQRISNLSGETIKKDTKFF